MMKHYLAEFKFNDAIITFTAENEIRAKEKLKDLIKDKELYAWDLKEVEA